MNSKIDFIAEIFGSFDILLYLCEKFRCEKIRIYDFCLVKSIFIKEI